MSVSHSSSLSLLTGAADNDGADDDDDDDAATVLCAAGRSVATAAAAGGAGSLATITCGSLPLAVAMLSVNGASAACAIGESTLDFRLAPLACIVLKANTINKNFIDLGNIFSSILFLFVC